MTRDPSAAAASVQAAFFDALANGASRPEPYPHWLMEGLFPADDLVALQTLPYPPPELGGVSGTREVHNNTRVYFDVANQQKFPICHAVSSAFQDPALVGRLAKATGAALDGTFLRIEYAQDTGGFWLKPHTDIGVKRFTLLAYISDEPGHEDLGTDIYADASTWVARSPFGANKAMAFVPSDRTWHGFEPRTISGIRKSLIINYVTDDWQAREQLSFPTEPVREG
jgi:hypothetical protein